MSGISWDWKMTCNPFSSCLSWCFWIILKIIEKLLTLLFKYSTQESHSNWKAGLKESQCKKWPWFAFNPSHRAFKLCKNSLTSFLKTLMLGKFEGRRRKQQRMRWLDSIIHSMDMSLSKLRKTVKHREALRAAVHGVIKSQAWLSDWTTATNVARK